MGNAEPQRRKHLLEDAFIAVWTCYAFTLHSPAIFSPVEIQEVCSYPGVDVGALSVPLEFSSQTHTTLRHSSLDTRTIAVNAIAHAAHTGLKSRPAARPVAVNPSPH